MHTSEEAEQFRAEIGLLHQRLSTYELHTGKGENKERICLTNIAVRSEPAFHEVEKYYGYECEVERIGNGQVTLTVKNRSGTVVVNHQVTKHEVAALRADPGYATLRENLKRWVLAKYELASPRLFRNLLEGSDSPIDCGTYRFLCGADFLFAGIVEVVYQMRCSLFHGELVPTREASECYEPAYRIVRRFLESIS
jgi:hypothetical protein